MYVCVCWSFVSEDLCVFCRHVLSKQIAFLALSNPDQRGDRLRDKNMEISAASFGKLQGEHTLTKETCDFSLLPLRHHHRRHHFALAIHNNNGSKYMWTVCSLPQETISSSFRDRLPSIVCTGSITVDGFRSWGRKSGPSRGQGSYSHLASRWFFRRMEGFSEGLYTITVVQLTLRCPVVALAILSQASVHH